MSITHKNNPPKIGHEQQLDAAQAVKELILTRNLYDQEEDLTRMLISTLALGSPEGAYEKDRAFELINTWENLRSFLHEVQDLDPALL